MTSFSADMDSSRTAPAESLPSLRAMGVGELLDATLRLYARNLPLLVGITAVAYVPYYLLLIFLLKVIESGGDVAAAIGGLATLMGFLVLLVFLSPLTIAATLVAVSERYLGRPVSILRAFKVALSRFLHIFAAYLIIGLIWAAFAAAFGLAFVASVGMAAFMGSTAGAFLAVVSAIVFGVAILAGSLGVFVLFSLVVPAVLLEGLDAIQALRRSIELTRGYRLKIVAVFIVLYAAIIFVTLAIYGSAAMVVGLDVIEDQVVSQVLQMISNLISNPLFYTSVILIYYDMRIRKEAFDLDYLSRSLDWAEGRAGQPPGGAPASRSEGDL